MTFRGDCPRDNTGVLDTSAATGFAAAESDLI